MIRIESLTKKYGNTLAVNNISLEIEKGCILGFLGPNGAGKSTTMKILTGIIPATSGKAFVCDIDVANSPLEAKKKIGYLPEGIAFYNEMTVHNYLEFAAEAKAISKQKRKSEISSVIEKCSLQDVSKRIIGNLSKGYKQRVGLAQAIIGSPEVLILDEPTVGLDPSQIIQIRELIKSYAGKSTVILSTHILQEVTNICTHTAIINKGKIFSQGQIDEINKTDKKRLSCIVKVNSEDINIILSNINGIDNINLINKIDQVNDISEFLITSNSNVDLREEIVSVLSQSNAKLLELYQIKSSIEDTYLKILSNS